MCADYSDAVSDGTRETTMFNRLIFLQRNWQEDDILGERPEEEFDELVSAIYTLPWNVNIQKMIYQLL